MPGIPTIVRTHLIKTLADASTYTHDTQHDRVHLARRLGNATLQVNVADAQKRIVQIVAITMACISISAALTALYWFVLMRRNFRRDLILLLILSDLFKNFCYLMFGAAAFANGQIQDAGAFCQASGYMLQTGLEACDLAVFFISLHMTLQIFPLPNTIIGYKGLYNIRYWVYAIWFILPNITASLAFINDQLAYQVVGAWCWLPVRPFWYRLALAWIPRYLITLTILCFAITIYLHVRSEFRIFERGVNSSSGHDMPSPTRRVDPSVSVADTVVAIRDSSDYPVLERVDTLAHESDHMPEAIAIRNARRHSLPVFSSPFEARQEPFRQRHGSQSATTSRRSSRQVTFDIGPGPAEVALSPRQQPADFFLPTFVSPLPSAATDGTNSTRTAIAEEPSPGADVIAEPSIEAHPSDQASENPLQNRRRAIKRQVRSLFVYPVAYLLFWTIPFIMHCMNYSDYYAVHPVFAITILASWCTTTLGFVDVIIFSWRERPWRHISGSDGTFIGSFCFWSFDRDLLYRRQAVDPIEIGGKRRSSSMPGILATIKTWTWRRLSSVAVTNTSNDDPLKRRATGDDDRGRAQSQQEPEKASRDVTTGQSPGVRNWFDNISEVEEPRIHRPRRPTWAQQ